MKSEKWLKMRERGKGISIRFGVFVRIMPLLNALALALALRMITDCFDAGLLVTPH